MLQLQVAGMSCGHCVSAITKAIQSKYPQAKVDIDLVTQSVKVDSSADPAEIARLVKAAGYDVIEARAA